MSLMLLSNTTCVDAFLTAEFWVHVTCMLLKSWEHNRLTPNWQHKWTLACPLFKNGDFLFCFCIITSCLGTTNRKEKKWTSIGSDITRHSHPLANKKVKNEVTLSFYVTGFKHLFLWWPFIQRNEVLFSNVVLLSVRTTLFSSWTGFLHHNSTKQTLT